MNKLQLIGLSFLSGILLAFSWFPYGFTPLVFVAFVPLLLVDKEIAFSKKKSSVLFLVLCSFIVFFLWNLIATWWIKNASFGGAAMAIITNALLMAAVFVIAHNVKSRIGKPWAPLVLITFWISFEYLHFDWDGTYPWLTLGNVFANTLGWVQWYEYTGVFGGSFWVLAINLLVFRLVSGELNNKKITLAAVGLLLVLPITLSVLIEKNVVVDSEEQLNVVVLQPNIDPYETKFSMSSSQQLAYMLALAKKSVNDSTDYLILPESALTSTIWEGKMQYSADLKMLRNYLKGYPRLNIIVGASTAKVYAKGEELSPTVRRFSDVDMYYDMFNTAFHFTATGEAQIYHKSKLVPGVERMPFPEVFKYVEAFAIDLGGATGSLGVQEDRSVFLSHDSTTAVAPIICYESIYGEFVGEFVNNGAEFIALITNDGWWGDTPGYKQHLKYGTLRALETRRWIARSANTGVSCFINPKGELVKTTNYWEPDVIAHRISKHGIITFYTKYGDYIGRYALYIATLLLVYSWLFKLKLFKNSTFVNT